MKKIFLLGCIACTLLITSCKFFDKYGKKVKINDSLEIYIKGDSTTEADAKKLGNYIAETWKENKNQKSMQLIKDGGTYTVKMVVDESKLKADSSIDVSFRALRLLMQMQVFPNNKVRLVLTDNSFKELKAYEAEESPSATSTTTGTDTTGSQTSVPSKK